MKTDYQRALEITNAVPHFYLGQQVETEYGRGIIVSAHMPSNGLYIEPLRTIYVVWFGTERALTEGTKVIQHRFNSSELTGIWDYGDDIETIGRCANCGVEFHIHKIK